MAMIHLEPQTLEMFSRALDGLKPPPNLSLSQWADKYRKLSAEASASQGQWNTDAAPFQREIMDAIGDVHVRKVVAMMCAQAGKTEGLILNTIGFYMSYHPASIMVMQPTVNLGESFSKDRLTPMLRDTPALRGLVNTKSRYSGNTISKKNFPGGMLVIVGANAPTDLRSRPIKVLLADEVDAYNGSSYITPLVSAAEFLRPAFKVPEFSEPFLAAAAFPHRPHNGVYCHTGNYDEHRRCQPAHTASSFSSGFSAGSALWASL